MLGDVYPCPDEPFESQLRHRNTHATYITNLSIWPHNPLRRVESAMLGEHLLNLLLHRVSIFRVYEVQIFFYGWWLAGWIKAVDMEQLGRPVVEPRSVECPATHMSEALSFAEIQLALLQGFLGALAVSNVLHGAEQFVGPSRCVSLRIAWHRAPALGSYAVDGAHSPLGRTIRNSASGRTPARRFSSTPR